MSSSSFRCRQVEPEQDALTTAETSCAYLHTLLKGRPQTACHRAEALALASRLWETPLTAAEDYKDKAAVASAQICSDAHGRWLAPVL